MHVAAGGDSSLKKGSEVPAFIEKDKDSNVHPTKGGRCITEYLTYDW